MPGQDVATKPVQDRNEIHEAMLQWQVGNINGLITKDKFCMSRTAQLILSASRYAVYLERKAHSVPHYLSDATLHQGGSDDQAAQTDTRTTRTHSRSRRAATLGSRLPTPYALESDSGTPTALSEYTVSQRLEQRPGGTP